MDNIEKLRQLSLSLPPAGVYENDIKLFTEFIRDLHSKSSLTLKSKYIQEGNDYITKVYQESIEGKWFITFLCSKKFRTIQYKQLEIILKDQYKVNSDWGNPDIIHQFIESVDTQNLLDECQDDIPYSNLNKIELQRVVKNIGNINSGMSYNSLRRLYNKSFRCGFTDDTYNTIHQIEIVMYRCPYYYFWNYINYLWEFYNIDNVMNDLNKCVIPINKISRDRGYNFETKYSALAYEHVCNKLLNNIYTNGNHIALPFKYNHYVSIKDVVDVVDVVHSPMVIEKLNENTTFSYLCNCDWRRKNFTIGEIDIVIIATTPVSCFDTTPELNCCIIDGFAYVRQVVGLIEMKSNPSDLSGGFYQHETKLVDPQTYIFDNISKTKYYVFRNLPYRPCIIVSTLLNNKDLMGVPNNIIKFIGSIVFRHNQCSEEELLSKVLAEVRKKYNYFIPINLLLDKVPLRIIIFDEPTEIDST